MTCGRVPRLRADVGGGRTDAIAPTVTAQPGWGFCALRVCGIKIRTVSHPRLFSYIDVCVILIYNYFFFYLPSDTDTAPECGKLPWACVTLTTPMTERLGRSDRTVSPLRCALSTRTRSPDPCVPLVLRSPSAHGCIAERGEGRVSLREKTRASASKHAHRNAWRTSGRLPSRPASPRPCTVIPAGPAPPGRCQPAPVLLMTQQPGCHGDNVTPEAAAWKKKTTTQQKKTTSSPKCAQSSDECLYF